MATIEATTNMYGITNVPTTNNTGIDFSYLEREGFQYTGRDNEGAFCFVGRRGAIRCLADVHGDGIYQARNEWKCYNVHVNRVTSFMIHKGQMIRKPAFFMKGEPCYTS